MVIDKNSGTVITLDEAKTFIQAFQTKYPTETKAFFVGTNMVNKILEQQNCIGIRIYNGYNEVESQMNQVLVGVDTTTEDMTEGIIVEKLIPCPSYCSPKRELFNFG